MPKLPVISGKICIQALLRLGFLVRSQEGSHVILVRDEPKKRLVVPNHKELEKGTLRAIIRQAGLTVEEFEALLK
jgi:predicted RNA binding protein YcfA (HicA-like mRNA interferase family)